METFKVEARSGDSYNHDSIKMKALGLTSDDYVEQRLTPDVMNRYPYTCISSVDFTKFSNDVSIYLYSDHLVNINTVT